MAIFHSYVKLPEGTTDSPGFFFVQISWLIKFPTVFSYPPPLFAGYPCFMSMYPPAIKPWHAGKSTSYRSCSHSNLHFIWDSPVSYEKMNHYSIDTPLYPYCMPIKSPFLLVLRRVITCKFSSFHQRSTCDAVGCRSLHWVAQAGLEADGKGQVTPGKKKKAAKL